MLLAGPGVLLGLCWACGPVALASAGGPGLARLLGLRTLALTRWPVRARSQAGSGGQKAGTARSLRAPSNPFHLLPTYQPTLDVTSPPHILGSAILDPSGTL